MSNSSATGGYLLPLTSQGPPGGLTLRQFLQTMVVGVSGYPTSLVRPDWQREEPLSPTVDTDWIAFGIIENQTEPGFAYTDAVLNPDNSISYSLNRQRTLQIRIAFYGPNSGDNIGSFIDGFQIQQNLEALRSANMGFKECSSAMRAPELVNELWNDRWDVTLVLVMQDLRTYNVLSFASASVTVNTVFENPYSKTINVGG